MNRLAAVLGAQAHTAVQNPSAGVAGVSFWNLAVVW